MENVERSHLPTGKPVGQHPDGHRVHLSGRAVAAFGVGTAFAIMLASGVALYLAPGGRVAQDLDWRWLGLDRQGWEALHLGMALLFTACVAWHFLLHLRVYKTLLTATPAHPAGHRVEALIAFLAVLLIAATALFALPPTSWLMDGHSYFKQTEGLGTGGRAWRRP
ncbi:DUF4405 domain-containing protein [Tropicimonas sp. IMCC34043]|uniref:DUF4405 domain-containing protein n=1 Tax=Tropicimonas sp. IMCC34043 TaxID=2248760 RepID=UPI000E271BD0|nr:DUF4405 domain-containing protein [Tropicimonas sp. IMCC34043]